MAHDCWFEGSIFHFHANAKTYDAFTKGLMEELGETHCVININPLHALERTNDIVTLGGDPSPHGGERGAISSTRGALVSLQGVPNIFACGYQDIILEPYVAFAGDCEMEEEE